ncbi:MAG: hypothetical protein WC220_05360 [Pedobacter sp.]|jgi:hypothetical protein
MLRSLAVALIISVLSFNWYGYDLLVKILETHYDEQLEIALDNNDYDTSQIIELDSKVVLPYIADMTDFERVDGEVMIDGVYYKFIERKYENGRIIYRCIPNTNKIKLHHARSIFYQLMNEIQDTPNHQKHPANPVTAKKTLSDYELQQASGLTFSIHELFAGGYIICSTNTTNPSLGINSPPPEYV